MANKKAALTYKDNFWSKKRVEQNTTMSEIAELLDINVKTASSYFTGQECPHEDQIKTLCEFFGVDLILGTREFINANKQYDATHNRVLQVSARKPKVTREKKIYKKTEDKRVEDVKIPPMTVTGFVDNRSRVERLVYGILGYDDFQTFRECLFDGAGDPLKVVYGKVDIDVFKAVEKALASKLEPVVAVGRTEDNKWEI